MGVSQEEIVINTQNVTKGLEALRAEHQSLLSTMKSDATPTDDAKAAEKTVLLEKSLEMIDLGLGEAHVMAALASHLQVCISKCVRFLKRYHTRSSFFLPILFYENAVTINFIATRNVKKTLCTTLIMESTTPY